MITRFILGSIIVIITVTLAVPLIPRAEAQQPQTDSDDLAKFGAIMQYIRSTPTPVYVKAGNILFLTTLDTVLSDIYNRLHITLHGRDPRTGESASAVRNRERQVHGRDG